MNIVYKENGENMIDFGAFFKVIFKKIHLIILCALVCGLGFYTATLLLIAPKYQASVTMYVNNKASSDGTMTLTQSDLNASAHLVDTYSAILKNVSVLRAVIEETGIDIDEAELKKAVSIKSVNNTEVFEVKVIHSNPKTAACLVNSLAEIGPTKISEIVDGSSVKTVNYADIPTKVVSPGYRKIALVGCILGAFFSTVLILILAFMDTTIKSEADFKQWNYPVLGTVPDLREARRIKKSGYGYGK